MFDIFYYAYRGRDGKYYVTATILNEYAMTGDYLLFDTVEDCVEYYAAQGIKIENGG